MFNIAIWVIIILFAACVVGWIISISTKNYHLSCWFNLGLCGMALLLNILNLIRKLMA